jgi:hypothetical protein
MQVFFFFFLRYHVHMPRPPKLQNLTEETSNFTGLFGVLPTVLRPNPTPDQPCGLYF